MNGSTSQAYILSHERDNSGGLNPRNIFEYLAYFCTSQAPHPLQYLLAPSVIEEKHLNLKFRQRVTWFAHLFKAVAYQYHRELGEQLKRLVAENGVIVDVGAHSGQHAKLFSAMVPSGTVYAFEPGSYALSILRKVALVRGLRNVVVIPSGLSDRRSTSTLSIPIKKRGSVGFGLSHLGGDNSDRKFIRENVHLTTLDLFVSEQGIQQVDLIKADIEGWECHFLRGAMSTIARDLPTIMIEVNEPALQRAGATGADIFNMLKPLDYFIFKTFENDAYQMIEVDGYDGSADYLFVTSAKAAFLRR